jgi:hypothetical protein
MRKCLSLRGLLVARIRLDQRKSVRPFKGIFWDDISEFESYMPSQPVRSLWRFAEGHLGPSRPRKIGQLATMPGYSLERLLCRAAGEKLTALPWNRDPRGIRTRCTRLPGAADRHCPHMPGARG